MRDPCANWWWRANWIFLPPADDEEAIAHLTRIKGIGRWSAEIYLLFAEGRPDIWPAGDLAVQVLQAAACPNGPAKRPRAKWPKSGARTRRGGDLHLALP
jgi:DNA-3-methyladenine glycosylase II